MSTYFFNCLVKGNIAEEQVAQWYERQGYQVCRIGSYRLAIDLLVWNDEEEFGVQVKLRSKDTLEEKYFIWGTLCPYLKFKEYQKILDIIQEDKLPVVLAITNGKEIRIVELMVRDGGVRIYNAHKKEILPVYEVYRRLN